MTDPALPIAILVAFLLALALSPVFRWRVRQLGMIVVIAAVAGIVLYGCAA